MRKKRSVDFINWFRVGSQFFKCVGYWKLSCLEIVAPSTSLLFISLSLHNRLFCLCTCYITVGPKEPSEKNLERNKLKFEAVEKVLMKEFMLEEISNGRFLLLSSD